VVKAVDAEKHTITFDDKAPEELAGKTFPVAKDAAIQIDDRPGRLAGLPPGARIDVGLSADLKTVRRFQASGPGWAGVLVKAVDARQGTITFDDDKAPEELAGKTFPVARDATITIDRKPGTLAGVPPGLSIALGLSADLKAVRSIQAEGPAFTPGVVKAVDVKQGTITFDDDKAPAEVAGKTFPLARDAEIVIDGQPGRLAGVPPGAVVALGLSVDQKAATRVHAEGRQVLDVLVKAVDAAKHTLTITVAGEGDRTFPVARDAAIEIDGKPGQLAAVPKEASATLSLCVDQKTVRRIQAKGP
jgi:hypothetical protein